MNSKIDADYIIKNLETNETYFVFIDEEQSHRQYCKSAFKKDHIDYMDNQQKLTLLQSTKCINGITEILHTHPNYKPTAAKNTITI